MRFTPLQSSSSPRPAPNPKVRSAFLGVCGLLFATSAFRVHMLGVPPPDILPFSAFLTPSTVSSASDLAGLFHPAATSRILSSGISTSSTAVSRFRTTAALSSLSRFAEDSFPSPPLPRDSPTGLSSVTEFAIQSPGISRCLRPVPLLSFSSSRCSRPVVLVTPSRLLPLMTLRRICRSHLLPGLQRIRTTGLAGLSRGCLPARGL